MLFLSTAAWKKIFVSWFLKKHPLLSLGVKAGWRSYLHSLLRLHNPQKATFDAQKRMYFSPPQWCATPNPQKLVHSQFLHYLVCCVCVCVCCGNNIICDSSSFLCFFVIWRKLFHAFWNKNKWGRCIMLNQVAHNCKRPISAHVKRKMWCWSRWGS